MEESEGLKPESAIERARKIGEELRASAMSDDAQSQEFCIAWVKRFQSEYRDAMQQARPNAGARYYEQDPQLLAIYIDALEVLAADKLA